MTSTGGFDGFYAHDTRFLSTFSVTINGERPLLLSSGRVEYFSAAFYARNPLAGGLEKDALSIARHRFVGDGLQDHIVFRNETRAPLAFTVELASAPISRTSSASSNTISRSATR